EIRTSTESSSMVAQRAGFILSDGSIVDIDGSSAIKFEGVSDSDYYIVVKHRNHKSIMSSTAVSLE
ncbi:MAG: hypothetical protein GY936_01850, partial [Ignavibacteriae bacterium]|nr:hypothetical protein [Ignavibacteriota bacterium]